MTEFIGIPEKYQPAVAAIANWRGDDQAQTVQVSAGSAGLHLVCNATQKSITYGTIHDLMRAVTLWLGHAKQSTVFEVQETPAFETCGTMIDVARNGVLTVTALKKILLRLASLGYSEAWLYLEDCFEVPGQPYFGHLRGRYTQAQLHDLAVYADGFGMTLVPAIQTLAHLQNALKWTAFEDIKDTPDVLWVEKPATTAFLKQLLQAASAPFLTNKMHIGMDEAYGLGHGNRLYHEGYVDQETLIQAHLKTVVQLCAELKLEPYMWSDMWFTIASPTNTMYDESVHFDPAFVKAMPHVGQVYWDYYHEDVATYEVRLKQHLELKQPIVYAGGLWTWPSLAPHQAKMLQSVAAGMTGAKHVGIKAAVATMWFDDGAETPFAAAWLGLQTFIEYQYHDTVSASDLAKQFALMQGESYQAFMLLDEFDHVPGTPANLTGENPSKLVLYEDFMLQKYAVNLRGHDLSAHYQQLAEQLGKVATTPESAALFDYYQKLALTLMAKVVALQALKALPSQATREISQATAALLANREALQATIAQYRKVWHAERRGNGYEVMDIRLGGQLARIETVLWRLQEWVQKRDDLAELQAPELIADKWTSGAIGHGLYMQIASAGDISH